MTPTLATIERGSFAGHETFPLRYTWLCKAVQHVKKNPRIFNEDDAMVELGVGKNMVRAIRHWGLVTGVLEESDGIANNRGRVLRPTALGDALFGDDGWDRTGPCSWSSSRTLRRATSSSSRSSSRSSGPPPT